MTSNTKLISELDQYEACALESFSELSRDARLTILACIEHMDKQQDNHLARIISKLALYGLSRIEMISNERKEGAA